MSAASVDNVEIDPVNVTWQIEEQSCVQTVPDVASSLQNKYFILHSALDAGLFHVWNNVGAAGVDPAPAGSTGIEVAFVADASASVIAAAIQAAVDLIADFGATVLNDQVTITNAAVGDTTASADSDTGFTVTQTQEGGDFELGLLDGDVESTFEEATFEVKAHQTGTTLLADIRQGVSAEITTNLLESDLPKLKEIFARASGGAVTPGAGTEVFGWGTSRIGQNTIVQARRLILKPVNATDDLSNLTFWKAYPMPGSLVISGENPKVTAVTWKIYRDEARDKKISLFIFGDQNQVGL